MITVLIMAGGTGGHVIPALSVAKSLKQKGIKVVWLGTHAGIEADLVPKAGIPLHFIFVAGLRGKSWQKIILAPLRLFVALLQSFYWVWRIKPAVVLGMGGFASGPGGVSAWLLRKPLIIHEQNAIPGLTNRLLQRFASRVLQAFPASFTGNRRAKVVGNPLREALMEIESPEKRLQNRTGNLRLLVIGGSLGAAFFNELIPQLLANSNGKLGIDVWHQTGNRHFQITKENYSARAVGAKIDAFIEDMPAAYLWADVVVARAGALTVSELSAVGVASILVPYPYAVDNHQYHNARYLEEAGGTIILQQKELNAQRLQEQLTQLANREKLLTMAKAAWSLRKIDATATVVENCLEVSDYAE